MNSTILRDPVDSTLSAARFAQLMTELRRDTAAAIVAIRAGFRVDVIKDASAFFDLPPSRIESIIGCPDTSGATSARGGRLDSASSERIWRMADVMHTAREVFANDDAACRWLRSDNRSFGGCAPLDMLDTEPGGEEVRRVLNAIATGAAI